MFANVAGGALMWAVHFLNKALPEGEYGTFGAYLAVVMVLPTMPLGMVLAQQTAKAIATNRERELSGVIRLVWWGTSAVWLVASLLVLAFQGRILERWHLGSPVGLWITLAIVLLSLWLPMFWGVLQGRQNFLWLGWSMMSNGIGRIVLAAVAVMVLHTYATGLMTAVLFGVAVATVIAAWQTRSLWLIRPQSFDRRSLLNQIIPLVLGFLGFQILFTSDTMFVKSYFEKTTVDFYVSAGTMSRALMWLVLPLASVMFPRIVHSAARSEKTNLMGLVLIGTAVMSVVGAVCLSLLGPWVLRIVYSESYVKVASSLLPWYAATMIPLAVANVLLNNLLARPASKLVPGISILALSLAYLFALTRFHESLVMVLQTMGICNLALLAVCAWFTWREGAQPAAGNGK
jgi:O-antigen/teichoic acid export membrane protein